MKKATLLSILLVAVGCSDTSGPPPTPGPAGTHEVAVPEKPAPVPADLSGIKDTAREPLDLDQASVEDLRAYLRESVALTEAALESRSISWKYRITLNGQYTFLVFADGLSSGLRMRIRLDRPGMDFDVVDVVMADDAWYWKDERGKFKVRPFEMTSPFPNVYFLLTAADLRLVDLEFDFDSFERVDGQERTVRLQVKSPELARKQIDDLMAQLENEPEVMEELKKHPEKLEELKNAQSAVAAGSEVQVDVDTGIIIGIRSGKVDSVVDGFDVGARSTHVLNRSEYKDLTASLLNGDRVQLLLSGYWADWKVGMPFDVIDVVLYDMESGGVRRVPLEGAIVASACFSHDRKIAYVTAMDVSRGQIGLVRIDLETGENVTMERPGATWTMMMFPAVSPDGSKLIVIDVGQRMAELKFQLLEYDLEDGTCREVGEPIDQAFYTWLPDGSGWIFEKKIHVSPTEPADRVVCRRDLDGTVTEILEGEMPVCFANGRILFRKDEDDRWYTCDPEGKDVRLWSPEAKVKGAFPSLSPDGTQVMLYVPKPPTGPGWFRIYSAEGEFIKDVDLPNGFWNRHSWR